MRAFTQKPKAFHQTMLAKPQMSGRLHSGQGRNADSILHLQHTVGNQAVPRLLQDNAEEMNAGRNGTAAASLHFVRDFSRIPISPRTGGGIQTKLAINKPGDEYEQEADSVAEQVMRMPEPKLQRTCACGGVCPECKEGQLSQESKHLQTKRVRASNTEQVAAPPIVQDVLQSPGQPLQPAVRAFMETRFGHDFSQVRVHADAMASESARAVNALAYTVGNDIVFNMGRYAPDTTVGRQLLAHELVHVRQQRAGSNLIQRQDLEIVGEGFIGPLTQNQRRAARSCSINCGTHNLGTLHAMALFYHASRRRIVSAGSPSATGVGISLHFVKSGTALPTSDPCHCNDHKIIQVLQNSHPIGTRGRSYVDNAGRSTPFYGDVYHSGSGRHQIFSGYPDAGRHITTTHSIYDRPQRTTSGRSGQNISWNAEACLACVKTGKKDKVLGCVTYGFRRNWNATQHQHDPVQGIGPACLSSPSTHFVSTLSNDPTTSSYQFET